jgi:hypothetical protein
LSVTNRGESATYAYGETRAASIIYGIARESVYTFRAELDHTFVAYDPDTLALEPPVPSTHRVM